MRHLRRPGKLVLTYLVTLIFLVASLTPRLTPRAHAGEDPAPPLPVPEDPLGQQPEQQTPEVSIDVDVRDGHVTVRVVDLWGPGRTPFVVRTYNNARPTAATAIGIGGFASPEHYKGWQLNQLSDITTDPNLAGLFVREADGNRGRHKFTGWETGPGPNERWAVYQKTIGTVTTLKEQYTCWQTDPEGPNAPTPQPTPAPLRQPRVQSGIATLSTECAPTGLIMMYLPKGATRRYRFAAVAGQVAPATHLIEEARDANGNVTTYTWTTFPNQVQPYVASVRDPVGRVTTYGYEQHQQICVEEHGETGQCLSWKWVYRLRTITDPWGRTTTYTYNAQNLLASVTNGAGRSTSYTYDFWRRLRTITTPRGHTWTLDWTLTIGAARVTRVTAPDGTATTYAYTGSASVATATVTDARGHRTTYQVVEASGDPEDPSVGNITRVTNHLGHVT